MTRRIRIAAWGAGLWLLAGTAWATQTHGDPEGLYVHQMAHLFFMFSMGVLIFWLRDRQLTEIKGWRYVQYSALLLIVWNLGAFVTHFLDEQTQLLEITRVSPFVIRIQAIEGFAILEKIYYITKLDHLWCVPALLFLYVGLKRLSSVDSAAVKRRPQA